MSFRYELRYSDGEDPGTFPSVVPDWWVGSREQPRPGAAPSAGTGPWGDVRIRWRKSGRSCSTNNDVRSRVVPQSLPLCRNRQARRRPQNRRTRRADADTPGRGVPS